ncbi:hypothetical protein ACP275_01G105200 [Erythranthe tilingii]
MAYAALLSLKLTVDGLLESENLLLSESEKTFIRDEFPNLNSFIKTIEFLPSTNIVDPGGRVKDAVQKLEDLIDSHLSDQLILLNSDQTSECSSSSFIEEDDDAISSLTLFLSRQLPKVNQQLNSFLTSLKFTGDDDQQQQRYSSDYTSVGRQQQNLLVGLDDQIKSLKEWILDHRSDLVGASVVGMTGVGKTTLCQTSLQRYKCGRRVRYSFVCAHRPAVFSM